MIKRVLHVVTYMGRGGLETMLMNYYRQIDRDQIQFDFLVHRKERAAYDDEIESLGGKIYRLDRLNPWNPKYLNALDQFFKEHSEYKVVHSHIDCMSGIPLKAAKKAGVPVRIAHAHSSNQDKDFKYLLKLYYKKKISAVATDLFACSEMAGNWMFGVESVPVLANAIDANKYRFNEEKRMEMREEFGITDEVVIGHVGRFSSVKNHDFLVEIFAEFCKKNTKAKLLLVGSGEKVDDIQKKVQEMNLSEKVMFLGLRSDVCDVMQAMDIFALPSLYEGLPVTIVEAQASGLPCLISDKVPIECKKTDLVDQVALSDSADIWANKIIQMMEWKRKDTFQEIKKAGFDIQQNAEKLQQFYLNAMSRKIDKYE